MKNCININTEEFKNLLKQSNMNPVILAAKISLWQDNNGLNKYPTLQDLSIKTSDIPVTKVQGTQQEKVQSLMSFLESYGFEMQESEDLIVNLAAKKIDLNTADISQVAKSIAAPLAEMLSYSDTYYEIEKAVVETERYKELYSDLLDQFTDSTKRNLKRLATKQIFKELLEKGFSEELAADMNIDKTLWDKIVDFVKTVIDKLKDADWNVIDKNISDIVEKTFKGEDYIRLTKKEGYKQVDFQQAFDENAIAKDIMTKIGTNPNIVLTGSIAYATQGTVYRKIETVVHDLDFVNNGLTEEEIETLVKDNYPDAIKAYSFFDKYQVDTYLIPPAGFKIANIQRRETGKITSYEVLNEQDEVVGTYELKYDVSSTGKTINEVETKNGTEAMLVDFFSQDTIDRGTEAYPFKGSDGKTYQVQLSKFEAPFEAKLTYSRFKDIWDYNRFIPNKSQEAEADLSIDFFDSSFPLLGDLKQEFKDEIVNLIEREYKPLAREYIAFKLSTDIKGDPLPYTQVFTPENSQYGPIKVFINETAVRIKEENLVGVAKRLLTETNKKLLTPQAIKNRETVGKVEKYADGTVAIVIKPSLAFVLSYSIDPNFTADTSTSAVKYYYLSQFLSQKGLLKEYAGPLNELYTKGNVQDRIEKERQFLEEREREIQTESFDYSEGDLSIDIPYDNTNALYSIPDFNKVKLKRESQIDNLSTRIETLKSYRKLNGEVNNVTARIIYLEKLQKSLQKDLDDYLNNLTEEDRFQQIKSIFEKDFEQVRSLLQNPTVENVTLAKDMIDYIEINSTQENEESIFGLKKGEITNPSVEKLKNLLHSETQLLKDLYDQVTDKYVLELMTPMKEKFFSYFPKGATETDIEALERIRDTHLKNMLEDISKLEQQFLAEGRNLLSDSDLLAQMRRLLYESEEHKMLAQSNIIKQKINLILPQLEQRLKELGYVSKGITDSLNYISLFYRKTKKGFSEPYLVGKYSEDWTNFVYGVFTRSREDLNAIFKDKTSRNISAEIDTVLAAKYKQLNENADFVDFRYLHDVFANVPFFDDPLYKKGTTAEADQYKADLIAKIGQSEYDEVVRKQTNYLREFQIEADIMTKEMLANPATNPLGVQTVAGLEQKFQNQLRHNIDRIDPFVLLDSHFTGNMSFVHFVQGITHNHFIKYNTFTPKVLNALGKPTPFYDDNFKIIENDDVLRTAWEVFEEASYFINASLIGSGRNLNKRSLLWFKKSFKEEFLNKNWKDTIKKQTFSNFFQDSIYWLKESMTGEKSSETSLTDIKLPSNMASFSSQVYEVHQNNVTVLSTLLKRVLKDKNKLDLDKMNLVDKQSFFETLGVIDEREFRSLVPVTKGVFSIGDLKEIAKKSVIETQTLNLPLMLKVQLEQAAINAARTSTTEKIQILLQKSQKQKTTDSTNTKVPRTSAEKKSAFWVDRIVRNQVESKHKAGKEGGNLITSWAKKIKKLNEENKPITIEDWKEGLKLFSQNLSREEKAKYKILTDRIEVVNNMLEQIEQANQTGQTIDINDETINPNSEAIDELSWNLKEEKAKIEQQIRLMGKDLMWSALLAKSFTTLLWQGMAWNYISSLFNAANATVQLLNRDGEFWTPGNAYKAITFVGMRGLTSIDKKYAKQWAIGEAIIDRLNIISDGSNEFQRSERKGNINSPRLFRKLFGTVPVLNYELVSDPMYATKYVEYYNQIKCFYCKAMDKEIKDINGKSHPLFDGKNFRAFDIDKNGILKLDSKFDTPENRETFLNFTNDAAAFWAIEIKTPINSINGDYSLTGSTMIKENLVGRAAMAYKTWLPEYMMARYSYDQKELSTGTIREGYIAGSLANKATRAQGYASLSQITLAGVVFGPAAIAAFPAGMLAIALPIMAVVGGAAIYSGAVNIPKLKKLSVYSMGLNVGIFENLYRAFKQLLLTNTVGLVEVPTNSAYAILQKLNIVNHLDANGEIRKPLINPNIAIANHKDLSERQLRSIRSLVRTAVGVTYCSLAMMLAAGDDEEEKELEGEERSDLRTWHDKQAQRERDKKNSWREKARIGVKNAMGRTMEEISLGTNPVAFLNMFIGDDSTIKGGTIPFTENLGESLIRSMQEEGEGDIVTDPKSMYYADSKFEVGLRRNLMFSSTKNIGKNEWLLGVEGILQKDFYKNNYEDWFKQTDLKEDQKKYKNLKVLSLVEIRERLSQQYLKVGYKEIKSAKDIENIETLAKREFDAQQYSPKGYEARGFYTEDQRRISTPESEIYFKNLKERE